MIRRRLDGGAFALMLAAGASMALVAPANAQAVPSDRNPDVAAETNAATDVNDAETQDDIRNLELDWSQLNVDASTLIANPASKTRLAPQPGAAGDMSWSFRDRPNGSAAVSVKQPLSPFLDARVGADMTVVHQAQTSTSSDLLQQKFSSDGQPSQSTGTAWAAITAGDIGSIWDKTAVEARIDPSIDPSQEQSKLGTPP
jgi:hypothetical protein